MARPRMFANKWGWNIPYVGEVSRVPDSRKGIGKRFVVEATKPKARGRNILWAMLRERRGK